jgi:hypothetical protein
MATKLFGHSKRKSGRVPGEPTEDEDESFGRSKGGPSGYEGKEHVQVKFPGFTRHNIKNPQDQPHMKSRVSKEEMHEMEDNYHMDVPDLTEDTLEAKIKRAKMKMDDPKQQDPKPLRGNLTHNVGYDGVEDTTGEEQMGPNDMQGMSKENRKKMIAAVTKSKMRKGKK